MTTSAAESDGESSSFKTYPAGTVLIHEGATSRRMFIIKEGRVRVYKTYLESKVTLAVLGQGEVFGELSFFDAEPRSASVEALSDVQVIVIDGEKGLKEISGLPSWVLSIFKNVFHRFREMDNKITILQSMYEYKKKNFKIDNIAKTTYLELRRFIHALTLIYDREYSIRKSVRSEPMYKEWDNVLGSRMIGLKVFWRLLHEHDFLSETSIERELFCHLNRVKIDALEFFLTTETDSERFLSPSFAAMEMVRKVAGWAEGDVSDPKAVVEIAVEDLPINWDQEGADEAWSEAASTGIFDVSDAVVSFVPEQFFEKWSFLQVIKAFDSSMLG